MSRYMRFGAIDLDVENMTINDLGDFVKQIQKEIPELMSKLSKEEAQKVNDIVNGVDKTNLTDISKELENLKAK